jgi:tripartite-type tricarboxylate transporter receptor subunit TctC
VGTVINHIRNGKLRPLGLGSTNPSKALPNVPTLSESGVPGYDMSPWIGAFAPAGTPKPIIDRLNAEINKALALPEVIKTLENQALDPSPTTVDQFNATIKADYEKYGKLIKMTGAKVE